MELLQVMTIKDKIINNIIDIEGGFVNDSSDSGGATNFGITESVARDFGYVGNMRDLPRELAYRVYSARYWDAVKADNLLVISESLAEEIVDSAINMGTSRAGKFLQRSLNVLVNESKLKIDGEIGRNTLDMLKTYSLFRDINVLIKALNCLQGVFYIELAERREKDKKFIYGWIKNRIKL